MLVLKLCQQFCPDKIDFLISNRLGDGADGEVFELKDDTSKVIKFSVLYQNSYTNIDYVYKKIIQSLDYIRINNPHAYARVYEHKYLGKYNRPIVNSSLGQDYILYYYIMEKLYKISEDEKKVFHSILSHEDRNLEKNFSIFKIKKMLKEMYRALDFNFEKIILFCESLKKDAIEHNDIHVRNIMKDLDGNFKLIDFDRSSLRR